MDQPYKTHPQRRIKAKIAGLFTAMDGSFQTEPVDQIDLTFEGIEGDRHGGYTRKSGGREPWYPRGTDMRNERQLSIVSQNELDQIAKAMEIDQLKPEWIGANIVLEGVESLTMVPASTLFFFENGVTLSNQGKNKPCTFAGAGIAENFPDRDQNELALAFPKHGTYQRGLVSWVEKPGQISLGEKVTLNIPEQWIYQI